LSRITYQHNLEAGQTNHYDTRQHVDERAQAKHLVEVVYYGEQTLMITHRLPEQLGESAMMSLVIILEADLARCLASAALKVFAQDVELHEEEDADVHLHAVRAHNGHYANGDGARLHEEADLVPRVRAGVEGVPRPNRERPVLHGDEEQQGDHEEEAQRAEHVQARATEQQMLLEDIVLAASCEFCEFFDRLMEKSANDLLRLSIFFISSRPYSIYI